MVIFHCYVSSPEGYPPVNQHNYRKSPYFTGKSSINEPFSTSQTVSLKFTRGYKHWKHLNNLTHLVHSAVLVPRTLRLREGNDAGPKYHEGVGVSCHDRIESDELVDRNIYPLVI